MRSSSGGFGRAKRARVGVEVTAVHGLRDMAGAEEKSPEALARLALLGICGKERIQGSDDALVLEVLGVELRQPGAVERRSEVEVVTAGPFAHEAELGDVGPRAAVRAAGHADGDLVLGKAARREPLLERRDEAR